MKEESNEDEIPKGYTKVFIFDEFDKFISNVYGLEVDEYIRIVDHEMTEEDAESFFDFTESEDYENGWNILRKYITPN
jgi:hypothetical protein